MIPDGMAEYRFEYSKRYAMIRFILLATSSLIALLVVSFLLIDYIGVWPFFIFPVVGLCLIFYLNGKNFRSVGVAFLCQDKLSIDLKESQSTFHFEDVETFKVEHFHGVSLSVRLRGRAKFRLSANDDCDHSQLEKLCADFEKVIEEFKSQTASELTREKSILESQWYFILLIVLTGAGAAGFIYSFMFGTDGSRISSFFVVFVPLLTMWGGYLTTRLKRK
jgi:hypothetical protein